MPLRTPTLPRVYHLWFRVLAAITSTCWEMRLKLLPLLWGRVQTYVEVGTLGDQEARMPQLLLMRCGLLSKNPSLAVHVRWVRIHLDWVNAFYFHRTLSVSLAFHESYMESSLFSFVECLCALPNLHTFEIAHCLSGKHPAGIIRAFTAMNLPSIRTLTVRSRAGSVIRACPNVKEVTLICGGFNIPDSVVGLLADMRHTIGRVAILHANSEGVGKLFITPRYICIS